MDLNKMYSPAGPGAVGPAPGGSPGSVGKQPGPTSTTGAEFRQKLDETLTPAAASVPTAGPAASATALKFSGHAVERMRSRGISFNPEDMKKIEDAVAKAAAKGSKDALILTGDSALIVSVRNKTVVTVMDKAAIRDNVFTNIDSAVVV